MNDRERTTEIENQGAAMGATSLQFNSPLPTPNSALSGMWEAIKEVFHSRELLMALAHRDLRIRYKQTAIGAAWALVMPLLMMVVFSQVFSRMTKVDTGGIPYPIFVFCGLLPWQFFCGCLKGAVESLTRNNRLVTKIYFPREVFPLSQIVSNGIDFLVASLVLVGLMLWYGVAPQWTLIYLPMVVGVQILFTVALSLLLSMGNLFYRDVKYVFEFVLTIWMFVSSVVYPIKLTGPWAYLLALNPMTPIIDAYRQVLLLGQAPTNWGFAYAAILSVFLCLVGIKLFHDTEHLFAEVI